MVLPDGPEPALVAWTSSPTTLTCSRRFRILCVVDDYRPGMPVRWADTSLFGRAGRSGADPADRTTRKPHTVVSDNGTELTSSAILRWSQERRVRVALHSAGQADAERLSFESFNGSLCVLRGDEGETAASIKMRLRLGLSA